MSRFWILLFVLCFGCTKEIDNCLSDYQVDLCGDELTYLNLAYPNNFPDLITPFNNPTTAQGVNLGRHLFYDPILSSDGTVSCASCHHQSSAFADPSQYSTGVNNAVGERNAPTIINPGLQVFFDWDGKSNSLESQASRPIFNEIELHNQNWSDLILRLESSDLYETLFCEAFGDSDIDSAKVIMALSQFQRTLISVNSKFDKFLRGEIMLTTSELNGFDIYNTERGDCFHCHPIGLFTNNNFHNNGLDNEFQDYGRFNITQNINDMGSFKSPTLRNIEYSAPYMHDGRFLTLDDVIEHYNSGGQDSPSVDPLMKYVGVGLFLTDQEKADLKAFLLTLSDPEFINNPDFSNPFNTQIQ